MNGSPTRPEDFGDMAPELMLLAELNRPRQFGVLDTVLKLLAPSPAVSFLMIRGSIAAGTSDRLSDIDLVVGIHEQHFPTFVAAHDPLFAAHFEQLLPAWPDTIVPDLGGLGFVHLVQHDRMLYQVDLYLAPAARKDEIAARTKGRLLHEACVLSGAGPAAISHAEDFIASARRRPPDCAELLTELLVLAWMIRKRIIRDQQLMAFKETFQFVSAARALIRAALSPDTAYLGWYHLEDTLGTTPIGKQCLRDLLGLARMPQIPSATSLVDMLVLALAIAERVAPDTLDRLKVGVEVVCGHVGLEWPLS